MTRTLGWTPPADRTHERLYALSTEQLPDKPTPLWLGINWYSAFDDPVRDEQGHYWVARDGKLGRLRGGHSIAAKPRGGGDQAAYWDFYDQGAEGACVGFAGSRIYSWHYGQLFFARWLWDIAKGLDVWPDTNAGDENGTSVKAGFDVVRDRGHVRWSNAYAVKQGDVAWRDSLSPDTAIRIQANLWIRRRAARARLRGPRLRRPDQQLGPRLPAPHSHASICPGTPDS